MGWRDAFASLPSPEKRKNGKDETTIQGCSSHFSDIPGGAPTPEAQAELMRLVPLVTANLSYFTEEDRLEALENALAHPNLALPFWRGKARQLGLQ